jgi:hypothetical protein
MAQSLADKATAGMTKAKKLFATAISQRKVAVEDDEEAAADAVRAARVSERGGADEGSLSGVISGRVTGAKAMRVVAGAAGKAVGDAERQLGKASQAVKSEEEQRIQVAHEIGRWDCLIYAPVGTVQASKIYSLDRFSSALVFVESPAQNLQGDRGCHSCQLVLVETALQFFLNRSRRCAGSLANSTRSRPSFREHRQK